MSVFVGQTLLQITANTGYADIGSATVTRILYEKPNRDTGFFEATVSGLSLIHDVQPGDIDKKGNWYFQAYWEIGGKKGYGKKKSKYFQKPIL